MSPLKEAAIAAIRGLPENNHLERILEDIIYHAKIARGLEDVKAGRTYSIEEIKAEFQNDE
jgi:predicted transcriptional regulator